MDEQQIQKLKTTAVELISRMGYQEPTAEYHEEKRRLSVFINDASGQPLSLRDDIKDALEHILRQIAHKQDIHSLYIDINNYRANREKLIIELSKAAARKVNATKNSVELPPMNAYERRLVHVELATRPDVQTESDGEGGGRRVIVRPFE